jgi:uncharacterized protein
MRFPPWLRARLRTRKSPYTWAWALFWTGLFLPAPGFLFSGFWGTFSGLSAIGAVLEWSRSLPDPVDARHALAALVLAGGFCSNVVFWASRVIGDAPITRGWRLLLLGSLLCNASTPFFLPNLVRIPGYWIWMAGWVLLCGTLLFIPDEKKAPSGAADAEGAVAVPSILWVWLGFLAFWVGVTVVNRLAPDGPPGSGSATTTSAATGPEPAVLASWFNDPGRLFLPGDHERFNGFLSAFEKETSIQVAAAVYPRVPAGSVEEFTLRTAEKSRLGRKGLDNGAILFVFVAERVARLEVGYGLEGAIPDVAALHILDEQLVPSFARGDYAEGLRASLVAILGASQVEGRQLKSPGLASVAWRKAVVAAKRIRREAWPTLRHTTAGERVGISLFGSLLGVGVWGGLANALRLLRAAVLVPWNLAKGRPAGTGVGKLDSDGIADTVLIAVVVVVVLGGAVVVAGGGGFGGAGALVHW